MHAKFEIIDPAYAKQLLASGISNRPISEVSVLRYARDMADGRWENNGQGIVLTESGALLDGQHRMHAVIRANIPVGMLVVRGVQQETFVTMDSGRARQLKDVLAIDGYKSTAQLASTARVAFNYIATSNLRESPTKHILHQFVVDHPYLAQIGNHVFANSGRGPVRRLATMMSAVLFLANYRRRYDPEIHEFHDGVFSGQGLFKGDSRWALREWIINHNSGVGSLSQDIIFSAVAKAWNTYARGNAMQIMRPTPNPTKETLPIVGFERAAFPGVKDIAAIRRAPKSLGKNTANLAAMEHRS